MPTPSSEGDLSEEHQTPLLQEESEDKLTTEEADTPDHQKNKKRPPHHMARRSIMKKFLNLCLSTAWIVIRKIWDWSAVGVLIASLLYHLHGGFILLALVIITLLGLVYNAQDLLLYFPDQPDASRMFVIPPSVVGLEKDSYENLFIQTSDKEQINAVLLKQSPQLCPRSPTLLFFHGNAGNIGHRLINAVLLQSVCRCNVLLVDYRGFGKSSGCINEEGFYKDAQAALDYLHTRRDINSQLIFVFGRSLGGAVAIHLASRPQNHDRIRGLIVENTFSSIPDMGAVLFNMEFIKWIPLFIVKNKYFSIQNISKVQVPTLFLSGTADELVPPKMMHALYQRCHAAKRLVTLEGGTHNETWQASGYGDAVAAFVTRVGGISSFQPQSSTPLVNRPLPLPPIIQASAASEPAPSENSSSSSSSYEFINV